MMCDLLDAQCRKRRSARLCRDWVQSQPNQAVDRPAFTAFVNGQTHHDYSALINRWLDSPTTPS